MPRILPKSLSSVALISVIAVGSTTYASLFMWNPKTRVPIPLSEALSIARGVLDDDAGRRYCTGATLMGSEEGDGEEGAWNLIYDAEDGSRMAVYVNMDGESHATQVHGSLEWSWGKREGMRDDLNDVKRKLLALLERNEIDASVSIEGGELYCEYRSRVFDVYVRNEDGSYSDELTKTIGPLSDGFVIEAVRTAEHDRDWFGSSVGREPYWRLHRSVYLLGVDESYLRVEMRFGHDWSYNFKYDVESVFGQQAR